MESFGKERARSERKHMKYDKIIRYLFIIALTIFLSIVYIRNYQINKHIDETYYVQPLLYNRLEMQPEDFDQYWSFELPEQEKKKVFFYRWNCQFYWDELFNEFATDWRTGSKVSPAYARCDHERLFGILGSKTFYINLYKLNPEDAQFIHERMKKTKRQNLWIMFISSILMIIFLAYWFWLYFYKREEWEKTKFAKLWKWLNRLEGKNGDQDI